MVVPVSPRYAVLQDDSSRQIDSIRILQSAVYLSQLILKRLWGGWGCREGEVKNLSHPFFLMPPQNDVAIPFVHIPQLRIFFPWFLSLSEGGWLQGETIPPTVMFLTLVPEKLPECREPPSTFATSNFPSGAACRHWKVSRGKCRHLIFILQVAVLGS